MDEKNNYKYAFNLDNAREIAESMSDKGYKIVGIEAEWGNKDLKDVFEDAVESLSHHGRFLQQSPPCTRWDLYGKYKNNTCFIFSHFDLDSVLGCLVLEGRIPDNFDTRAITEHVGWVDVVGQHRAHEDYENYKKWAPFIINLNSFLKSLKRQNKKSHEMINEFAEYFNEQLNNADKLELIVKNSKRIELEAYNALDKTFSIKNKLHVFISYSNYLSKYCIEHDDYISVSEINIQYDSKRKKVSVGVRDEELAKKYFGENGVISILQKYFGEEAGGRITVSGSPKNKEISFTDFIKLVKEIKSRIAND